MVRNNLGYLFECRTDTNGAVGVVGKYNVMYKGDKIYLTLLCSVDHVGKIVMPSRINRSLGFETFSSFCETCEDITKFIKSNKPYFYKIGDFALLGYGTLVFDRDTRELISSDSFDFYVPVTVSDSTNQFKDSKGNSQPSLICEKLSARGGINVFKVKDIIEKAYSQTFLSSISPEFLDGKEAFLCSLVL